MLTESNGAAAPHGVVAFNNLPSGTYRDGLDTQLILANGGTGAQAHATCNGSTAQLESAAVVTAWQGGLHAAPTPEQPFFNYVPFQTTSAGLDDKPEAWTPALAAAGFDLAELATAAGAKAACEAKGGVYVPADTLTTTSAALSSGLTAPLEREVATLKATSAGQATQIAGLTSEVGALKTQVAGLLLSARAAEAHVGVREGQERRQADRRRPAAEGRQVDALGQAVDRPPAQAGVDGARPADDHDRRHRQRHRDRQAERGRRPVAEVAQAAAARRRRGDLRRPLRDRDGEADVLRAPSITPRPELAAA